MCVYVHVCVYVLTEVYVAKDWSNPESVNIKSLHSGGWCGHRGSEAIQEQALGSSGLELCIWFTTVCTKRERADIDWLGCSQYLYKSP